MNWRNIAISGAAGAVLAPVVAPVALGLVGFSAVGPVAGSLAAMIQGWIGSVGAGSAFAVAQSIAMGGAIPAIVPIVGGAIGAGGAAIAGAPQPPAVQLGPFGGGGGHGGNGGGHGGNGGGHGGNGGGHGGNGGGHGDGGGGGGHDGHDGDDKDLDAAAKRVSAIIDHHCKHEDPDCPVKRNVRGDPNDSRYFFVDFATRDEASGFVSSWDRHRDLSKYKHVKAVPVNWK